ncbi:MAG: hypothetical protein JOZ09_18610 [Pseudonocardiales bacterium]|nr:hypothetical protein [Pseudonocardiales bacterium]
MRYLFGPIALPMRRELSKDAELLVLRPENTVIRRQNLPAPLHARRPSVGWPHLQLTNLLNAVASVPVRPRRILVVGTLGAGKSTIARRVATVLNIAPIEIDALFHGELDVCRAKTRHKCDLRLRQL